MPLSAYAQAGVLRFVFRGTTAGFTGGVPPAAVWAQFHVGDPGPGGVLNPCADTTRQQITFTDPSGGAVSQVGAVSWAQLATGGTVSLTNLSLWDASTGGNCLGTAPLTAPIVVNSGDPVNLTSGSFVLT
jgi:hypothetical protein